MNEDSMSLDEELVDILVNLENEPPEIFTEIFTSAAEIVNKVRILYRVYKKSLLSLRSKTSVFSLYFQVYYTAQQQNNLLITDFINLTNWDAIVPWNALSYYGLSFLLVWRI